LELPITDPVLIFAIAMLVFLTAPMIFERFKIPGIIGLIVMGAAVGPNALNLLERDATIVLLGTVGLLYLMFIAGIEIDLHGFKKYRNRSIVFGSFTFLLPQVMGTIVFLLLGFSWPAAILIASMFASHTLVAYPIATRLGISKNEAVTTAVGGTIITDTAALLVLGVVAASVGGDLDAAFWTQLVIALSIYVVAVLLLLPRIGRWFFRNESFGPVAEYIFVLAALFTVAWFAEVAGIEAIVGAFFAGLALNRLIPESSPLANRIHFFGNALFIPFFLISVGMLVDVRVLLAGADAWIVMGGMSTTVVATKLLAAKVTEKAVGYGRNEGWTMFGLTVPQAAATLAATLIGFEVGLFDDAVVNGSIMMILVTCVIGPWVVEKYGRLLALQEERKPYRPSEAPQRILIPMANPATAEDLMDLAMVIRYDESDEPLYPLIVVPEDIEGAEARVADAEKALGHSVHYASGAAIPVNPITRVDGHFARGIRRAITERRISTVVVGWDGKKSRKKRVFGTVLDNLLDDTKQLVLVAKLGHPLNTTKRIITLLPRGSDRHPGFYGAVRTVKQMAHELGTPVLAHTVEAPSDVYEEFMTAVKPDVEATFTESSSWRDALDWLRKEIDPDDLVVVLSARQGRLSWSPDLAELPGKLADLVPQSFVMIYPSLVPETAEDEELRASLDEHLAAERFVLDLPELPYETAIDRLLRTQLRDEEERERVLDVILSNPADEIAVANGVAIPHARIAELDQPYVFVGLSPDGIVIPEQNERVEVVVLVLSPAQDVARHQRLLARVSEMFTDEQRTERLRRSASPQDVFAWFRTDDDAIRHKHGPKHSTAQAAEEGGD